MNICCGMTNLSLELVIILLVVVLNSLCITNINVNITNKYNNETIDRIKRQVESGVKETIELSCDFGSPTTTLQRCGFEVPEEGHPKIRWRAGLGSSSFWMGGPQLDHTQNDDTGGYVYFETSYQSSQTESHALRSESDHSKFSSNLSEFSTNFNTRISSENTLLKPLLSKFPIFQSSSTIATKDLPIPTSSLLPGPDVLASGPQGYCLSFFYSIYGLSADKLKIYLKDAETGFNRSIWESYDGMDGQWIRGEILYTYGAKHKIIFEAIAKKRDDPDRIYRGYIAVDDIQLQAFDEAEERCKGHCTFDGGMCGWTNQESNDKNDEFDWQLGRGSQNIFTGPSRDFISFGKDDQSGGFIHIDSSFPRRPGDRALLISPEMQTTDNSYPLCMKFATHMYGNGIGTLRVSIRYKSEEEEVKDRLLWEMKGESGNHWYLGQLPVSSPLHPFQITFEGIIGQNSLGVIAIDNISFHNSSCPISPQTASGNSGDCTFEENMCSWHNPLPHHRVDDFDWLRQFSFGGTAPKYDHTKKSPDGYFINLSGDALQPQRGGTRAWLISPDITPDSRIPRCMSFFYYMSERTIDPAGPSLGSLRVYVKPFSDNGEILHLVWRLNNHQSKRWRIAKVPLVIGAKKEPPLNSYQILIEGIWGDGRVGTIAIDDISFFDGNCTPEPIRAAAVNGECSFDRDLCGYRNISGISPAPESGQFSPSPAKAALFSNKRASIKLSATAKESLSWKLATPTSRPANLQDHTFRAPTGYLFFDVFNQNVMQYPVLRSQEFPGEVSPQCLSFWFTPFGRGESTLMSVSIAVADTTESTAAQDDTEKRVGNGIAIPMETRSLLWKLDNRRYDTSKPEWKYGQLEIMSESPYRVQFQGEASDGGFALDDITFYNGSCETRPPEARVALSLPEAPREATLREQV